MSAPTLPLSISDLARAALAEAKKADIHDHIQMIESQVRLTHTVEMLLARLGERAA